MGGTQIQLQIDENYLRGGSGPVLPLRDSVRQILRQERLAAAGGIQRLPRGVKFIVVNPDDQAKVLSKLQTLSKVHEETTLDFTIEQGADGEIRLVYGDQAWDEYLNRVRDEISEVIHKRAEALGFSGVHILREGNHALLVQLPGVNDPKKLLDALAKTGRLEFRFLALPDETNVAMMPMQSSGEMVAIERLVVVSGEELVEAQVSFSQQTNDPQLTFRFNARGTQRFGEATSEGVGRQLAIIFNNEVLSAPRINTPITGGAGVITGHFTREEVENMALQLRSGALPAKLQVISVTNVGPGQSGELMSDKCLEF